MVEDAVLMRLKWFVRKSKFPSSNGFGWGGGFIVLPDSHKLHGVNFKEISVPRVELTSSEHSKSDLYTGCWVVGFDSNDLSMPGSIWTREKVLSETKKLAEHFERRWI